MEISQTAAIRALINGFQDGPVENEIQRYVLSFEKAFQETMDIEAFIMGIRCLFSWHRLEEFEKDREAHNRILSAWYKQNEETYTNWLSSGKDDTKNLMWAKWTFQAKHSIFEEWIQTKHTMKKIDSKTSV
jgi:hypothetical protein